MMQYLLTEDAASSSEEMTHISWVLLHLLHFHWVWGS